MDSDLKPKFLAIVLHLVSCNFLICKIGIIAASQDNCVVRMDGIILVKAFHEDKALSTINYQLYHWGGEGCLSLGPGKDLLLSFKVIQRPLVSKITESSWSLVSAGDFHGDGGHRSLCSADEAHR